MGQFSMIIFRDPGSALSANQHSWRNHVVRNLSEASAILLTGATGYVGMHVLRELSRASDRPILCMVRAARSSSDLSQLQGAARKHNHVDIDWRKVEVIKGDLSIENGGIDLWTWRKLGRRVGEIYHLGADVNFIKSYEDLERTNARGTSILASFAKEFRIRRFHHISTMGVLAADASPLLHPSEILDLPQDGYSLSKLAAEFVVAALSKFDTDVSIYRLGEVMPSPDHPYHNPRALMTSALSAFGELGLAYKSSESFSYSPIDIVVRMLTSSRSLSNNSKKLDVVHAAHPDRVTLAALIDGLQLAGCRLQIVEKREFAERLADHCAKPGAGLHCLIVNDAIRRSKSPTNWTLFGADQQSSHPSTIRNSSPTATIGWPTIDAIYLADVLSSLMPGSSTTPLQSAAAS